MNYITAYQMRISVYETMNCAIPKFLGIRNVSSSNQREVNYLPFGSIHGCVLILETNVTWAVIHDIQSATNVIIQGYIVLSVINLLWETSLRRLYAVQLYYMNCLYYIVIVNKSRFLEKKG